MPADVFVDANILVYAHDLEAGAKHDAARDLVAGLWDHRPSPWLSIQVLQELLVTLSRKGVARRQARATVENYMHWRVVDNALPIFARGLDEMERWRVSLWDAMILAAARESGVDTIWSEDLNPQQDYGGMKVVNPLG